RSCARRISTVDISVMVISMARHPAGDRDPAEPGAPVTPAVFLILLALAEGESHGYGIMQDVDRITQGGIRLGPGTLYRSIQRMLVDGLIEELAIALDDESDDDRRRYHRPPSQALPVARAQPRPLP